MIYGVHTIIYSRDADADRAFFRDVLEYEHVDAHGGWLIFALPPAELAFHPAGSESHEIYLMVDDVDAFIAEMQGRGLACTAPENQGWGILTHLTLPSGARLGVYQPRHASPIALPGAKKTKAKAKAKKKAASKAKKKTAAKARKQKTRKK